MSEPVTPPERHTAQKKRGRAAAQQHALKLRRLADASLIITSSVSLDQMLQVITEKEIARRHRLEDQLHRSQTMESLGRFAGGVAHDFNNLLTAISGFAELAARKLPEQCEAETHLVNVCKTAERARVLTHQLLAFARRQVIEPQVVNFNDLVMDVADMLRRLLGDRIDLVVLPAPDLGSVKIDASQFERVLVNLAMNARDAMPSGGRFTLETANITVADASSVPDPDLGPGEYVQLTITDTGMGMTDAVKAHLFEPFFTTKPPGRGTGLGLATVYGIVTQSGGHIWAASAYGHGTTFTLLVPRTTESRSRTGQPDPEPCATGTETIMLVEPEPLVRDFAARTLRALGYTVLEASAGGQALILSHEHAGAIHLLITDIAMPRVTGIELAQQLRSVRSGVRTLYVSADLEEAAPRLRLQDQDAPVLRKPYTVSALSSKVRVALRREDAV